MSGEAQFYREQAQSCEMRLSRVSDPRRRSVIERERRDWTELAGRAAKLTPPAEPRTLDLAWD